MGLYDCEIIRLQDFDSRMTGVLVGDQYRQRNFNSQFGMIRVYVCGDCFTFSMFIFTLVNVRNDALFCMIEI